MEKSFSAITRLEAAKVKFGKEPFLLAELAAYSFSCGNIKIGRGSLSLELSSEFEEVILRIAAIIKRLYANAPEIRVIEKSQPKKHTCFVLEISPQTPEGQLLFEIGLLQGIDENYRFGSLNPTVFETSECFDAILRGAFLGCGVLCDPHKEYRLEFVLAHEEFAVYLLKRMLSYGFQAKNMTRRDWHVVYIKQIENISDILILIGARNVMLDIENIRVYKDVKNRINRSDNCIIGNMGKTITAAQRQLADILIVQKTGIRLSSSLREACELRQNHPEASLAELAALSETATKSALNKRFIKLHEMAAAITERKM